MAALLVFLLLFFAITSTMTTDVYYVITEASHALVLFTTTFPITSPGLTMTSDTTIIFLEGEKTLEYPA